MKIIFLFVGLLLSQLSFAELSCVPLTDDGHFNMQLTVADTDAVLKSEKIFAEFMKSAKAENIVDVITTFSKFDSSQSFLRSELRRIPDKYSLYKSIGKTEFQDSFKWGNYVVSIIEYSFKGKNVRMAQAFFCSNNFCQLSNALDRPNISEDLLLRFLDLYRINGWQSSTCSSKGNQFYTVTPTVDVQGGKLPLNVYLNVPFKSEKKDTLNQAKHKFSRCMKKIKKYETATLNEAELIRAMNDFTQVCAKNMQTGDLVPAVNILEKDILVYMTPSPFLSLLSNGVFRLIYQFDDNGVDVQVYVVKGDGANPVFFVLPLVEDKGQSYLDWEYYSQGLSHVLLNSFFTEYVKNKYPKIF